MVSPGCQAVEMRDNPKLANIPMAVGGIGMLSTSNYLARKYGVRAAMPGFIAKKLCPELVIVPSNMEKYAESSDSFPERESDLEYSKGETDTKHVIDSARNAKNDACTATTGPGGMSTRLPLLSARSTWP